MQAEADVTNEAERMQTPIKNMEQLEGPAEQVVKTPGSKKFHEVGSKEGDEQDRVESDAMKSSPT